MQGVLSEDYARDRQRKRSHIYRLQRRSTEIIQTITKYFSAPKVTAILDIGTADGLMLSSIKKEFPNARCVGLEYSKSLICMNKDRSVKIIQGDALNLPFSNNLFDILIATAVIEHVLNPEKMLKEALRVLRPGGMIIVTTPDPFWEEIAEKIGHLKGEDHCRTFDLKNLSRIIEEAGFRIMEKKKFMISPIGLPGEFKIEKILKAMKLNFLLLNQLISAIKN